MANHAHTTSACPRLDGDAPRITTAQMLALLGPPTEKRRGRIVGIVVRHVPRRQAGTDLELSPVLA